VIQSSFTPYDPVAYIIDQGSLYFNQKAEHSPGTMRPTLEQAQHSGTNIEHQYHDFT
jgi:hypothetical protein|tara:strand:- start:329 stop:499 length:171 start_codon:yes stop_codon:yes gene_type:complete